MIYLSEGGENRMKLTKAQKEEVNQIQKDLIRQIGDREVTVEYTAAAMMELCENLDYDMAVSVCQRIWRGAGELYRLCREDSAFTESDYVECMLDRITEQMSREQKKGFFLLALDSFEKNRRSKAETEARAAKTEAELKKMLSDRIRMFSKEVIGDMAKMMQDLDFQGQNRDVLLKQRIAKEDAFLFAAAVYLAGLNGVLPKEFGEYPELLGICSAVQMVLFTCCKEQETIQMLPDIVSGVICAAFGAALMLSSSVVAIAAESILFAMEFYQLGILLSLFSSMTLYIWFAVGGAMFIEGIGTVLTICMKKFQERRDTQAADSEQNETVKTTGWWDRDSTKEEEIWAKFVRNGI